MSQKYKLAIGDVVEFEVKFALLDKATPREFSHTVVATRAEQAVLNKRVTENPTDLLSNIVKPYITDVRGQTLVIDVETGQPASFNAEVLDVILGTQGVGPVHYHAYMRAISAKEKNS